MEQTAVQNIMPEKSPHLDPHNVIPPYSPTTGTPILTPKAGDLRSVASMPSLQSFNSLQGFQSQIDLNEFDVFDFAQLGNDAMYNELDQLQTPDVDPLSPTFYDFHGNTSPLQHPLLTPELSGSVGSGTSLSGGSQLNMAAANGHPPSANHSHHANLMANNIEGLGIAENRPRPQLNSWPLAQVQDAQHQHTTQWPPLPSPDNALRRSKVAGPPRVTKKPSKQLLKQRKSRTNLVSEAAGPSSPLANSNTASVGRRSSSPTASSSTLLSGSSAMANPTSPRKSQQHQNIHPASSQPPQINGMMQKLDTVAGDNQVSYMQPRDFPEVPGATNEQERPRISPNTPYRKAVESARLRGKASASPAMQSPLRPGQETRLVNGLPQRPRLQTAAAATALYMPPAQQGNSPRKTSMAAAAAAAAAVASYNQPVTPLADKQTSRNSPSTIVMSTRTEASHGSSTIKQAHGHSLGAPSPTPAARIHSNSKLVASASDSSPAKGMWKQAGRVPLPPSQLPKPILSPRKSASTSNMRRETRRKQNKIIPEMSSSLNQFQVDLKPKHRTSKTSLAPSAPPGRTAQSAPSFFNNQMVPQFQHQQQQQQFGNLVYDMGPMMGSSASKLPTYYPVNNAQHQGISQGMLLGASSHQNAGMQHPRNTLPPSTHQMHGDLLMPSQGQNPVPILQMPELARRSASLDHASSTVRASASTQSKVQPQGEPLQHVWASRPQPQPQTQQSQRRQFQAQASGAPARTQSAGANRAPESYELPESPQFRMFEGQQQQQQSLMERAGQPENFQSMYQSRAHAQAHAHTQAQAQAQAQTHSHPRANSQSQPMIRAALSNQVRESPMQSTPTGFVDSPINPSRHSMPDLDSGRHGLGQSNEGDQDTSMTSEFMAQFINDDAWDTNEIDMGSQWDLMDALEPQM